MIYTADCLTMRDYVSQSSVDLAFADPPYNIGFDYSEEYDDNLHPSDYKDFCRQWMNDIRWALKPNGSFWLLIGDEWAAELKVMANELGFHLRSWVVWHYTFGVNCTRKFTRSHAHLFYFTKHETDFTFNADQIRVPSAREVVYNDKRASASGRLPDDTWVLRPQAVPESFPSQSDTWYVPRLCGTHNQRVEGAANQLPEQLLGRIIRSTSNPGELVYDPMCGTGTALAVAKKLGRRYVGFEQSDKFARLAQQRLDSCTPGDELDGPIPHGG